MAVIGLDFDGTVVRHEYPKVGKDVGAVKYLKALIKNGHKIVLNTMRGTKNGDIEDAIKWFEENNIPLYGINRNPNQDWTDSPKVYADLYIDDLALGVPKIYDEETNRYYVDWIGVRDILAGAVIEKPLNKDTIKKIVNLYRKWLNNEELAIEDYDDYIFNNLKNQ